MARELDQDELIERWTLIGDDLERVPPPWRRRVRGVIEVRQEMSRWDVENPSAAPSPA